MAGHGPPPIPTALKVLRGNPGRKRLNTAEPKPGRGVPDRPALLDGDEEARIEWDRILPLLVPMGLATRVDRAALTAYCLAWSHYVSKPRSPDAFRNLMRILGELGLTPSSRSRIKVDAPPLQSDLEKFREKHG